MTEFLRGKHSKSEFEWKLEILAIALSDMEYLMKSARSGKNSSRYEFSNSNNFLRNIMKNDIS